MTISIFLSQNERYWNSYQI